MRRLLLLRHAKTERAEPGERDRDRKLTERGRTDAPVIGNYIVRHHLIPDLVLYPPQRGRKKPGRSSPRRSPNRHTPQRTTGSTMPVPNPSPN